MMNDLEIVNHCHRLILDRDPSGGSELVTFDSTVFEGVRYITFTAVDPEDFNKSYNVFSMIKDMLFLSVDEETFSNHHFQDSLDGILDNVIRLVDDDNRIPICLAGHGVGGSLAVLVGYALIKRMDYNVAKIVTFGAPGSLNYKKLNKKFSYLLAHVATQYVLPKDKNPKMFRWTKYRPVIDIVSGTVKRTVLDFEYHFDNHSIGNYENALVLSEG